jgi:hypothetical protein
MIIPQTVRACQWALADTTTYFLSAAQGLNLWGGSMDLATTGCTAMAGMIFLIVDVGMTFFMEVTGMIG